MYKIKCHRVYLLAKIVLKSIPHAGNNFVTVLHYVPQVVFYIMHQIRCLSVWRCLAVTKTNKKICLTRIDVQVPNFITLNKND